VSFKKTEIPWANVVHLHAEIARRAEESFFSMRVQAADASRWTSLTEFEPCNLSGRWIVPLEQIASKGFRNALQGGGMGDTYIGGPCWWQGVRREGNGAWQHDWIPFFYRAVRLESTGNKSFRVIPEQGGWEISPLAFAHMEKQVQFSPPKPLSEMIPDLLESAGNVHDSDGQPLSVALRQAIVESLHPFQELFTRELRLDSGIKHPTPWVLFCPPESGPLTQHLMRDYRELEQSLAKKDAPVGGLKLFEGFRDTDPPERTDILPIVPLNKSQRSAVAGILESRPVTVISGPPGCGKSQVVLGVILNAWAKGTSVLFASNNNQAVDVVRERLKGFEEMFPIAIRAGTRSKSNLIQGLQDTLNYMTGKAPSQKKSNESAAGQRDQLLKDRASLQEFLDSKLPQQVDEAMRSALTAYGQVQATTEEIGVREMDLLNRFKVLGMKASPEEFKATDLEPVRNWVEQVEEVYSQIRRDAEERAKYEAGVALQVQQRDRLVQAVGLDPSDVHSWTWLTSSESPEALAKWAKEFDTLLLRPLERELEPFEWNKEYDSWASSKASQSWAISASEAAAKIRRLLSQKSSQFAEVEVQHKLLEDQQAVMDASSIPLDVTIDILALQKWRSAYATEIALPLGRWDWLPYSTRKRAIRQMMKQESLLRLVLPLAVWNEIGQLDSGGRKKLTDIIVILERWISVKKVWDELAEVREQVSSAVGTLSDLCLDILDQESIPSGPSSAEWLRLADSVMSKVRTAKQAATAWQRRERLEQTKQEIRTSVSALSTIAPGVPLWEAWIKGAGSPLVGRLGSLASNPTPDEISQTRAVRHAEVLNDLVQIWRQACDAELAAHRDRTALAKIPTIEQRVNEWHMGEPASFSGRVKVSTTELPSDDSELLAWLGQSETLMAEWEEFRSTKRPELDKRQKQEAQWAIDKLTDAVALLPAGSDRTNVESHLGSVLRGEHKDWPTEKIPLLFQQFSPSQLRARISGMDSELESISFEVAKRAWLERVYGDTTVQEAMDALHAHYKKFKSVIGVDSYNHFRASLAAVPVWVTTAQSPQAIPMLPDLFDVLVIDEATQCTVTNLLPLVYRAKRLVVIGDPDQLPAIPHLSPDAETALADKFDVPDEVTAILGHAENDVYHSALKVLPHGRHDVIALAEHYRSHPLIIGFSNHHVYQTRLQLRTDPTVLNEIPFGSSVYGKNVRGTCERGAYGRSWVNKQECDAVVQLLHRLRNAHDAAHLSVGVVTPFRAHAIAIENALDTAGMRDGITVGAVHSFQGGERDVMLFSPVVAKGITEGAARWVEDPKNLINVAVTRARKAFFLVGDFAACRQCPGILGNLIKYVEICETLRKSSKEELELFSWMVLQGWPQPEVHRMEGDIEVDFVLSHQGRRLAIEVDGSQHNQSKHSDAARDTFLRGRGYFDVLRIPTRAVRETPSLVVKQIGEKLGLPT